MRSYIQPITRSCAEVGGWAEVQNGAAIKRAGDGRVINTVPYVA